MKRINLLVAVSIVTAVAANAQNKIDFAGRMVVEAAKCAESGSIENISPLGIKVTPSETFNVIVEFEEDTIDFGNEDVEVISTVGNIAVVCVTPKQMTALAENPSIKKLSLGFEKKPLMYKARTVSGVDAVQAGLDGLSSKYTGKGVITGLMDTGLDVNHISFKDADGNPRTKALWVYSSSRPTAYTTADQISNFTTENNKETHGTHVLGIMSGGYSGPGDYAIIENRVNVTSQSDENSSMPFSGIATDAEIAAACGSLTDANIISAVQNIVSFAASEGKPCVVNLSLGNNLGPHDGTSALSKALSTLGNDAIICVAAGNEGDQKISISSSITGGDPLKTFVSSSSKCSGTIQFWGSSDKIFSLRFVGYDRSAAREVFSYAVDDNMAGSSVTQNAMSGFGNAFSGSATISSNIDTGNNRYNVTISLNLDALSAMSNIVPGFVITPQDGEYVDGFSNGPEFLSNSVGGYFNGSTNNTINDMACADNVVAVGSYCTNIAFAVFGANGTGTSYTFNPRPTLNQISSFSSYGHSFNGENLPHVCAPGEVIISAYSKYYMDAGNITKADLAGLYTQAKSSALDLKARNSIWAQMQGTSMASPFAAGVIALWLEANPNLGIDEVKRVISETSTSDIYTNSNKNRWGAGKLNALEGIKYVLQSNGVNDLASDATSALFLKAIDGNRFEVCIPAASRISARLYNISGICVAQSSSISGDTTILDASNVAPGYYFISVDSNKLHDSRKIMLR